jgi:hypothetical protein
MTTVPPDVQIGLRWYTVTAQKTIRTIGSGDGVIEVDAREAAEMLRGSEELPARPARPDHPDELAARVSLLSERLGAVPVDQLGDGAS